MYEQFRSGKIQENFGDLDDCYVMILGKLGRPRGSAPRACCAVLCPTFDTLCRNARHHIIWIIGVWTYISIGNFVATSHSGNEVWFFRSNTVSRYTLISMMLITVRHGISMEQNSLRKSATNVQRRSRRDLRCKDCELGLLHGQADPWLGHVSLSARRHGDRTCPCCANIRGHARRAEDVLAPAQGGTRVPSCELLDLTHMRNSTKHCS